MGESLQITLAITGAITSLLTPLVLAWVAYINSKIRQSNDIVASTNKQLAECAQLRDLHDKVLAVHVANVAEALKASNGSTVRAIADLGTKVDAVRELVVGPLVSTPKNPTQPKG